MPRERVTACELMPFLFVWQPEVKKKKKLTGDHTHTHTILLIYHYTGHNRADLSLHITGLHAECWTAEGNHTLSPSMVNLILRGQKKRKKKCFCMWYESHLPGMWSRNKGACVLKCGLECRGSVQKVNWCHIGHSNSVKGCRKQNKIKHPMFL